MIYVRDDDVLVHSSSHADSFGRFRGVHNIILKHGAMHRPGILITEIREFPEAIEFCKIEAAAGRMDPQFHGIQHIDYGKLTGQQVVEHLQDGKRVFMEWFGKPFKYFYTPWGASSDIIKSACESESVIMRDCHDDYYPATNVRRDPNASYETYKDKEIMIHWWAGLGKLVDALSCTMKK